LPDDPEVWLRHETIDEFVLTGCTDLAPRSAQTYRAWLRHIRATLAWLERGEQAPPPMRAPAGVTAPYSPVQLGRLRSWAEHLPGQARTDALALMALAFGCGLTSGELAAVRTEHLRHLDSGAVVVTAPGTERLIVCRAAWEDVLVHAADQPSGRFVFRPRRAARHAKPARELGYRLALDYKVDQRGVQGSAHGALLIDGFLACPLMPGRLATATTGLDDAAIRTPSEELTALISAREPYLLRLKQSANAGGAIRFQCPASGTSPSVTCPRFDRLHQRGPSRPATVDLTDARQRAAHPAAKPRVLPPAPDHKTGELPKICHQHTITLHPGDLGHLDKFRQDLPYLSPSWRGTYSAARAMTEGLNGRLKGHDLDLADPKNQLAHGRVAQTILIALLVAVANDHFLDQWRHIHQPPTSPTHPPTSP
jgi:hypothetical protein